MTDFDPVLYKAVRDVVMHLAYCPHSTPEEEATALLINVQLSRLETLREGVEKLATEYDQAAANPENSTECMYANACSEFATALEELLDPSTAAA